MWIGSILAIIHVQHFFGYCEYSTLLQRQNLINCTTPAQSNHASTTLDISVLVLRRNVAVNVHCFSFEFRYHSKIYPGSASLPPFLSCALLYHSFVLPHMLQELRICLRLGKCEAEIRAVCHGKVRTWIRCD